MSTVLVIMTRVPVPGKTKTRLMTRLTGEECAGLQEAMLKDLGRVLEYVNIPKKIFYTDGRPDEIKGILGSGEYLPQKGENLGERMADAVDNCLQQGYKYIIIIGTDFPGIQPELIGQVRVALESVDVVVGPTVDGGYFLLALKTPHPEIFAHKAWGTSLVLEDTLVTLKKNGVSYYLLEPGQDIDTFKDAQLCYQQLLEERANLRVFPRHTFDYLHKHIEYHQEDGAVVKISNITKTACCRKLEELWLHVLYKCNLSCRHCLFTCSPETEGLGELNLAECQEYVTEAVRQGVKAIYVTGGEPLLWPYLREFLNWYYSLDQVLPLTILTNGTLIDLEQARYFSVYTSQGLNLRISLECYTEGNHEEFRGPGSFAQAIQGIKNLNACGIRPWVAYVNKSGGSMDGCGTQKLEADFRQRLGTDHGLEIAGLKVIAAYSKGRFAGKVNPLVRAEMSAERLAAVQCSYGVAVSRGGVFPCPVLVDIPRAKLSRSLPTAVGRVFNLDFDFCASCFATGTKCGN